jgi:hypothetical protein
LTIPAVSGNFWRRKKKPSKFFEMEELSASKNTYAGDGESWRVETASLEAAKLLANIWLHAIDHLMIKKGKALLFIGR